MKNKNGLIEFMRFIFAINIVLFHTSGITISNNIVLFRNGWIGVEFFFIVTGFFLSKQADKHNNQLSSESIGNDTLNILYKKFVRVFPTQLFSFIATFILLSIHEKTNLITFFRNLIHALPNLFMLDMTGVEYYQVLPYGWYLSAMFISIAVIYPLLRKHYDYMCKVFFPLVGIVLLGWILKTYEGITCISLWTGITYKGMLRGFGCMLIGCTTYEVTKLINTVEFTRLGKIVIALFEIIGYAALLIYTNFNASEKIVLSLIIFTALSVAITFSNKSILSSLFNNKLFLYLGELSLPIYLNQYFGITFSNELMNSGYINGNYIHFIALLITIVLSIINVIVLKYFKPVKLIKEKSN